MQGIRYCLLTVLTSAGILCPVALAHDSPEHVVEALNRRMVREGKSADLLYRRACEYRALGKLDLAAADLEAALALDKTHAATRAELARVRLDQGKHDAALAAIESAIAAAGTSDRRARLTMVRAEIHSAAGRAEQALSDCQFACSHTKPEVDWLLFRSQLQASLGRHTERAEHLHEALAENPAAVVRIEWIEALIDAGRLEPALDEVESHLAQSRWKGAWLVRRGRIARQLGKSDAAGADFRAAIVEISGRLNPSRPDVALLADRGLAYALTGNRTAAEDDLALARRKKADPTLLRHLEAALATDTIAK